MSKDLLALFLPLTIFLFGLSGAAGQQASSIPRMGILIPESSRSESQVIKGLRDELKELGYREGKQILFEIRDAKRDRNALQIMASALVNQKVDLVVTTGTRATLAAKTATSEIPIVFTHPANPVLLGLVKSMERPGVNVTGVAGLAQEMTEKRLELFREILPKLERIYIVYDSNNEFSRENFSLGEKASAKLGLQVLGYGIKSADELKATIGQIPNREGDGLFHVPDDLVEGEADFIFDTARQKKLPTMFNDAPWASRGALAAYGPSYYQMGRQAGRLAVKILRGQKPEKLPIERASKFDLVINYRTVRYLGLTISPAILKKADNIIR